MPLLTEADGRGRLELSDVEVEALTLGRVLVFDRVLSDTVWPTVQAAVESLAGAVAPAGMGHGAQRDIRERGDHITWLLPESTAPALLPLTTWFSAVRQELNRTTWLGLRAYSLQAACYATPGARYARHLDAFRRPGARGLGAAEPVRTVTCIVYLNPEWTSAHGGLLRWWTQDEHASDVEPRANRAVLFLADRVPHEVLPSHHPRWAVTAWFYVGAVSQRVAPWE